MTDVPFTLDEKEAYRFDSKVRLGNECHEWIAGRDRDGYGQFSIRGRDRGAHVVSWQRAAGREVREGRQINHLCKNESCVNAKHLQEATPRENILHGEGIASKNLTKTHCLRGHDLTEANCKPSGLKRGRRECLTCSRELSALFEEAQGILGLTRQEYRSQFGQTRGVALDIIKRYG